MYKWWYMARARARPPSLVLHCTSIARYGRAWEGKRKEDEERTREIKRAAVRLYPSTRGNGVERDSRVRVRVPGPS